MRSRYKRGAPLPSTTPQSFKLLNSSHNRRDLCQQTLNTIAFIRSISASSTDTSTALLRRLARQSDAAMLSADTESIEKQDIRRRYIGKQAPRPNSKKLTAALVIDGMGLMKLESEQRKNELLQAVCSAGRMGNGKAKVKEPTKRTLYTLLGSSEFFLPLIGV